MAAIITLFASSAEESGGWGFLIILATVVAAVLVIGGVWTFVARRASRVPKRSSHQHHDQGVRGS